MLQKEVDKIIIKHEEWNKDKSKGKCADFSLKCLINNNLSHSTLNHACFMGSDASGAIFSYSNLENSEFSKSVLKYVGFKKANLVDANFYDSNLRSAFLKDANLQGANLLNANLEFTNLRGANLKDALLPSSAMILKAYWGWLPDDLTTQLMRLDCSFHPVGKKAFDKWASGGDCPYKNCDSERMANFEEKRKLWSYAPSISIDKCCEIVLDECCPGWR